jgi:hypothetical protein
MALTLLSNSDGLAISLVSGLYIIIPTKALEGWKKIHSRKNINDKTLLIMERMVSCLLSYNDVLVKSGFQVLNEELPRYKTMLPDLYHITVVHSVTQLCQGHV